MEDDYIVICHVDCSVWKHLVNEDAMLDTEKYGECRLSITTGDHSAVEKENEFINALVQWCFVVQYLHRQAIMLWDNTSPP